MVAWGWGQLKGRARGQEMGVRLEKRTSPFNRPSLAYPAKLCPSFYCLASICQPALTTSTSWMYCPTPPSHAPPHQYVRPTQLSHVPPHQYVPPALGHQHLLYALDTPLPLYAAIQVDDAQL